MVLFPYYVPINARFQTLKSYVNEELFNYGYKKKHQNYHKRKSFLAAINVVLSSSTRTCISCSASLGICSAFQCRLNKWLPLTNNLTIDIHLTFPPQINISAYSPQKPIPSVAAIPALSGLCIALAKIALRLTLSDTPVSHFTIAQASLDPHLWIDGPHSSSFAVCLSLLSILKTTPHIHPYGTPFKYCPFPYLVLARSPLLVALCLWHSVVATRRLVHCFFHSADSPASRRSTALLNIYL